MPGQLEDRLTPGMQCSQAQVTLSHVGLAQLACFGLTGRVFVQPMLLQRDHPRGSTGVHANFSGWRLLEQLVLGFLDCSNRGSCRSAAGKAFLAMRSRLHGQFQTLQQRRQANAGRRQRKQDHRLGFMASANVPLVSFSSAIGLFRRPLRNGLPE